MDKTNKLRERGFFITLLNNFTKAISDTSSSFLGSLNSKIFRVRIENEKYFVNALEKTAKTMEKMSGGNMEYKQVGSVMVDNVTTMKLDSIQKIDIAELSQKDVIEKLDIVQKTLSEAIKKVSDKDIVIPPPLKQVDVEGIVDVSALPEKLYSQFNDLKASLKALESGIKGIKLDVPTPKDIIFPTEMSISNLKALQDSIVELKTAIKEIPQAVMPEFPDTINIGNFPAQKIPQPVTNFNLNPLQGILKTTGMTVGNTATLIPATAVERRRHIQIFNNDDTNILYIGGSDVTTSNGIPIDAKSFSQGIDASSNMAIYGISTTDINIRVLEITSNLSGM